MTTFSPDPPSPQDHQVSELDLAAFALSEDDLSSLRGLSGIWRGALAPHLAAAEGDLALLEFLVIAERLPHVSAKPMVFPADPPAAPLGSWTLLAPDRMLQAARCVNNSIA